MDLYREALADVPARMIGPIRTLALLLLAFLGGCAAPDTDGLPGPGEDSRSASPTGFIMRYEWNGDIDQSGLAEPSGLVYHGPRGTLFAVGDEGSILEMALDGEPLQKQPLLEGTDLEGVTCDPATGLLYVAVEGEEAILEVAPDTLSIRRRFDLPRRFRGRTIMAAGGEGIEGITFVPDADHRFGGTFFVANQAFSLDDPEDRSVLVELELPIRGAAASADDRAHIVASHPIDVIDLAGLHYDAGADRLFAVCDSPNALLEIGRDGRIRRGWAFPGDEQEGLAIIDETQLYIAQDVGGILHIRWINR